MKKILILFMFFYLSFCLKGSVLNVDTVKTDTLAIGNIDSIEFPIHINLKKQERFLIENHHNSGFQEIRTSWGHPLNKDSVVNFSPGKAYYTLFIKGWHNGVMEKAGRIIIKYPDEYTSGYPGLSRFSFQTRDINEATPITKMVLQANGYLGLGNEFYTPSERLHVDGNAKIEGHLKINDFIFKNILDTLCIIKGADTLRIMPSR